MSRYMFSGDYIPLHTHVTYAPNRVTRLLQSTFSLYTHALVLGKLHTEKSLMKCKFSVGRRSIKSEMLHIKSEMLHVRQASTAKIPYAGRPISCSFSSAQDWTTVTTQDRTKLGCQSFKLLQKQLSLKYVRIF